MAVLSNRALNNNNKKMNVHFQPNGIDVPSVIGSASSVITSLLAGDENFGKVLGNYVGESESEIVGYENRV